MNRSLILFAAFLIFTACATQKPISEIVFDKYHEKSGFSIVALPPSFVAQMVEDERNDQKEALKKVKDLRVMTFTDTDTDPISKKIFDEVTGLLSDRNFEELFSVYNSETKMTLQSLQSEGIVEELYLLVLKENKLFLASMIGRLEFDKMQEALKGLDFDVITKAGGLSSSFDF